MNLLITVGKEGGRSKVDGLYCWARAADGPRDGHYQVFVVVWRWHFRFQFVPSLWLDTHCLSAPEARTTGHSLGISHAPGTTYLFISSPPSLDFRLCSLSFRTLQYFSDKRMWSPSLTRLG